MKKMRIIPVLILLSSLLYSCSFSTIETNPPHRYTNLFKDSVLTNLSSEVIVSLTNDTIFEYLYDDKYTVVVLDSKISEKWNLVNVKTDILKGTNLDSEYEYTYGNFGWGSTKLGFEFYLYSDVFDNKSITNLSLQVQGRWDKMYYDDNTIVYDVYFSELSIGILNNKPYYIVKSRGDNNERMFVVFKNVNGKVYTILINGYKGELRKNTFEIISGVN
ncbi:MAG: hypothetical protein N4A72_08000 [Bacteroidales bacterium]|jgi:hypothetical protein|nr:hypothetical protein [Bacteroidales bacterium]